MSDYRRDFIAFCIASGVLRFGSFVTKSGRTTPYFFNAGLFNTGRPPRPACGILRRRHPAPRACRSTCCSVLPTRASCSPRRPRWRSRVPGATCPTRSTARKPRTTARAARSSARRSPAGCSIVDDVMTAGTAVRESVALIRAAGAHAGWGCGLPRPHGTRRGRRSPRCRKSRERLRNAGRRDRESRRPARISKRRAAVRGESASDRRIPPTIRSFGIMDSRLQHRATRRARSSRRRRRSRRSSTSTPTADRQGRLHRQDCRRRPPARRTSSSIARAR